MKKLTTIFSVFAFAAAVANAADIDLIYTSSNAKGEAKWFDESSWGTTGNPTNLPPSDNAMAAQFEWDFQHLYLDRDTTMSYLILNRDIGVKTSTPTLSLYDPETKAETNLTFDISQNVAAGASSANIIKGHPGSGGFNAKVDSMNFIFDGGTINITDSSEGNTGTRTANIFIKPESNDVDFSGKTYSYTFNSNVVSTENLYIEGKSASNKAGGVFKVEFNKELSLVNGSDYKTLTLGNTKDVYNADAAGNMTAAGLAVVIGKEATANVLNVSVGNNATLIVDGVLNTLTTSSSNKNNFNTGSTFIINGEVNYSGPIFASGKIVVGENGVFKTTNKGDPYILLGVGSELVINSKTKGNVNFDHVGLRMSNGSKLTINGDGLAATTKIWVTNSASVEIAFNASTSFTSFCWCANDAKNITMKFADDVTVILDTFSTKNPDKWAKTGLTSLMSLVLENYTNGQLQIKKLSEDLDADCKDDMSVVKGEGFVDGSFEWIWHDETNTYWLTGKAAPVPEPATVAVLFGLFAMALVVYRKRRY